jgi:hypothetical protein
MTVMSKQLSASGSESVVEVGELTEVKCELAILRLYGSA